MGPYQISMLTDSGGRFREPVLPPGEQLFWPATAGTDFFSRALGASGVGVSFYQTTEGAVLRRFESESSVCMRASHCCSWGGSGSDVCR